MINKKLIALLLAVLAVLMLTGCEKSSSKPAAEEPAPTEEAEAPAEEAAPAEEEAAPAEEEAAPAEEEAAPAEEEAAPAEETEGVTVDYGTSELYTKEEMDAALALIWEEFDSWEGCEMQALRYGTDDCNTEENIQWLNELKEDQNYTQCIEFVSDFHSPKEGGGAWEADKDYKDWQWWLARSEGGDWELLTWGY